MASPKFIPRFRSALAWVWARPVLYASIRSPAVAQPSAPAQLIPSSAAYAAVVDRPFGLDGLCIGGSYNAIRKRAHLGERREGRAAPGISFPSFPLPNPVPLLSARAGSSARSGPTAVGGPIGDRSGIDHDRSWESAGRDARPGRRPKRPSVSGHDHRTSGRYRPAGAEHRVHGGRRRFRGTIIASAAPNAWSLPDTISILSGISAREGWGR